MRAKVQVAVAGDVTEAEEIQAILREAGIESELEQAPEADALAVLVAEESADLAQEAIEAVVEPDELEPSA
jgi:hypothetical protein